MRRSLLRTTTAVLALAAPFAGASTFAFADDGHHHSEITIRVTHDGASVREGGRVNFTVEVTNKGEKALKDLAITQLVPSALKADAISGKGRVVKGEAVWKRSLGAGESAELTMSGTLGPGQKDAKPGDGSAPPLSTTACVREDGVAEMLACDSSIDPVQAAPAAGAKESGAGLGTRGMLAVAGGVVVLGAGGYLVARRRSVIRARANVANV